jgi:SAM-dependent methyltransferase
VNTLPGNNIRLWSAFREWWAESLRHNSSPRTFLNLVRELWLFVLDSTPERQRRRYGDVEYDWDHGVNTTSATVSWRERLLGIFHSPYQPTDPALFHEMLGALSIDFSKFTFVDLGSGKGRTLMMASDYPFHQIIGIELLPELNRAACENLKNYSNPSQKCFDLKSICADARDFEFPADPIVLYLFNPLPEAGLIEVIGNLERSLHDHPRPFFVLYHNPLLEHILTRSTTLKKIGGTHQYSVFSTRQ